MIRILDHLFRADLIMHMQIGTDGHHYMIFVEYADKVVAVQFAARSMAEEALDKAKKDIDNIIMPWEDDEEEDFV